MQFRQGASALRAQSSRCPGGSQKGLPGSTRDYSGPSRRHIRSLSRHQTADQHWLSRWEGASTVLQPESLCRAHLSTKAPSRDAKVFGSDLLGQPITGPGFSALGTDQHVTRIHAPCLAKVPQLYHDKGKHEQKDRLCRYLPADPHARALVSLISFASGHV